MTWVQVVCVFCFLSILPSQLLANIGTVIDVKQGATVTRAGDSQVLRKGMEVAAGDAISTDRNGLVQLVFVDQTKMAIGPNAQMVLDVSMLRGNRKAKNFTVQALGGSFRFISGKSRKRAYKIKTPTATMAVRGTIFDIWVAPGAQSAMLVLQGTVQICGSGGPCRSTGRVCSLYATGQSGGVGRPVDQAQYDSALKQGFPFIQSQDQLQSALQVDVEGCSGEQTALQPLRPESDPSVPQPPPQEPEGEVKDVAKTPGSTSPPPAPQPEPVPEEHHEEPREEKVEEPKEEPREERVEEPREIEAEVSPDLGGEGLDDDAEREPG